ncbi:hypothetical protein LCGC14_0390010 [marine sediment metagenome]|uniref:Uncharacterized protein n=1 Tax=marine sediment metagenome TaxID=412755 RepID=A0A0F9T5N0_9ZZZZ
MECIMECTALNPQVARKMMNKLTVEQCLDKLKEVHGNYYDYSFFTIYNGNKQLINIVCKKHGKFRQSYANHVRGHGCPKCKCEKLNNIHKSNSKEFIIKSQNIHNL